MSLHPCGFVRTEVLVERLSKDTDPSTHPHRFGSWDGANKDSSETRMHVCRLISMDFHPWYFLENRVFHRGDTLEDLSFNPI